MHRISRSCWGSVPMPIRALQSPTKAMPARPTGRQRARAASSRSFRTRPTRRTSQPSSRKPSIEAEPASSRLSESSSASSASPYAAKRQSGTSRPSSLSPQHSSWSNPSTPPRSLGSSQESNHGLGGADLSPQPSRSISAIEFWSSVYRGGRPVAGRQISPSCARAQHPEDVVRHAAVVHARHVPHRGR